MNELESCNDAGNEEASLLFAETAVLADVVPEVASSQEVHDQVEILPVLEGVIHIDDEDVVELRKNFPFVHDGVDAFLADDSSFAHLFHGIEQLSLLALHLPNLSKAALTYAVVVLEVGFGYR